MTLEAARQRSTWRLRPASSVPQIRPTLDGEIAQHGLGQGERIRPRISRVGGVGRGSFARFYKSPEARFPRI